MKRMVTALFSTVLFATSPAWAGGGHGYGKHESKHAEKAWKKDHKAWEKQQKYWAKHGNYHDAYVVTPYYYRAPAVIHSYAAPVRYTPQPRVQVVLSLPLY